MSTGSHNRALEELIDEFARVFDDAQVAREFVHRVDFPRLERPAFDTPLGFWGRVLRMAADGKLVGGVEAIVEQARMAYPGNRIFAAHATRSMPAATNAIDNHRGTVAPQPADPNDAVTGGEGASDAGSKSALAVVGAATLSKGLMFLYAQAGKLLKQYREANAIAVELPSEAFESLDGPIHPDLQQVAELESEMRQLRRELSEYGQGIDEIDTADTATLALIDALRRTLEIVYEQSIVFKGERIRVGGVRLTGVAAVEQVRGYVAGVRAGKVRSGEVLGMAQGGSVEQGGKLYGVEVDVVE